MYCLGTACISCKKACAACACADSCRHRPPTLRRPRTCCSSFQTELYMPHVTVVSLPTAPCTAHCFLGSPFLPSPFSFLFFLLAPLSFSSVEIFCPAPGRRSVDASEMMMKVTPNDVTDDGDGRGFIPSETAPGRCGITVWHHEEPVRSRSLIPRHGQPRQLLSIHDDKSGRILPPFLLGFFTAASKLPLHRPCKPDDLQPWGH